MDAKLALQLMSAGVIVIGGITWVLKDKFKIDVWWKIKEALKKKQYPVQVACLQRLAGKTYRWKVDRESRKVKKHEESMKSLSDGKEHPPIDYSMYIPDKLGKLHMLALDTDSGERYPLLPLTYDEVFVYDQDGNIVFENEKPLVRDDFLEMAIKRGGNEVAGLKALSKGRKEFFLQRIEKAALKHPYESISPAMFAIGFTLIVIVLAVIIFFKGSPEIAEAGAQAAAAVP